MGHCYPSLYATGLKWRKLLKLHRGAFNYVLVTMQLHPLYANVFNLIMKILKRLITYFHSLDLLLVLENDSIVK